MIRCVGNLFWGNHFADLLNFGRSQTISLVSSPKTKFLCKFSKNYESTTAITLIVFHAILRFDTNLNFKHKRGSSFRQVRGLRSHEQGDKTWSLWLLHCVRKSYGLTKRVARLPRNCQRYNAIRLSLAF